MKGGQRARATDGRKRCDPDNRRRPSDRREGHELRPLGEFATWRAGRAVGDHDLNSFLLRLDPIDPKDEGLQPGMTVWLPGGAVMSSTCGLP